MANVFIGALGAATLVAGITAWSTIQNDAPAANRLTKDQTSIAKWEVSRLGSDQICTLIHNIDTGKSASHLGAAVKLSNQCNSQFPVLAEATFVARDSEGNVSLMSPTGDILVEFMFAEQFAQESIYPKSAMLTLEKK